MGFINYALVVSFLFETIIIIIIINKIIESKNTEYYHGAYRDPL